MNLLIRTESFYYNTVLHVQHTPTYTQYTISEINRAIQIQFLQT